MTAKYNFYFIHLRKFCMSPLREYKMKRTTNQKNPGCSLIYTILHFKCPYFSWFFCHDKTQIFKTILSGVVLRVPIILWIILVNFLRTSFDLINVYAYTIYLIYTWGNSFLSGWAFYQTECYFGIGKRPMNVENQNSAHIKIQNKRE